MTDLIVKVQLPLQSNEDPAPMLIYNRSKSLYWLGPIEERFVRELKDYPKGFYKASLTKDGLKIGERVPDQEW